MWTPAILNGNRFFHIYIIPQKSLFFKTCNESLKGVESVLTKYGEEKRCRRIGMN